MQTSLPLEYGYYYHIYNRGINRQNIFFEERNYHYFLKLYVKYIVPVADTYAYCLMKNHFHFLVRIKTEEAQTNQTSAVSKTAEVSDQTAEVSKTSAVLRSTSAVLRSTSAVLRSTSAVLRSTSAVLRSTSAVSVPPKLLKPNLQFGHFFNSYAKAINNGYQRTGSLFQSRFGRIRVDSDRYFIHLITYIHQNPQKHGFVDDFRTYPYSSYRAIHYQKPSRVNTDDVLAWFGGLGGFQHCHQAWADEKEIEHLIVDDFF